MEGQADLRSKLSRRRGSISVWERLQSPSRLQRRDVVVYDDIDSGIHVETPDPELSKTSLKSHTYVSNVQDDAREADQDGEEFPITYSQESKKTTRTVIDKSIISDAISRGTSGKRASGDSSKFWRKDTDFKLLSVSEDIPSDTSCDGDLGNDKETCDDPNDSPEEGEIEDESDESRDTHTSHNVNWIQEGDSKYPAVRSGVKHQTWSKQNRSETGQRDRHINKRDRRSTDECSDSYTKHSSHDNGNKYQESQDHHRYDRTKDNTAVELRSEKRERERSMYRKNERPQNKSWIENDTDDDNYEYSYQDRSRSNVSQHDNSRKRPRENDDYDVRNQRKHSVSKEKTSVRVEGGQHLGGSSTNWQTTRTSRRSEEREHGADRNIYSSSHDRNDGFKMKKCEEFREHSLMFSDQKSTRHMPERDYRRLSSQYRNSTRHKESQLPVHHSTNRSNTDSHRLSTSKTHTGIQAGDSYGRSRTRCLQPSQSNNSHNLCEYPRSQTSNDSSTHESRKRKLYHEEPKNKRVCLNDLSAASFSPRTCVVDGRSDICNINFTTDSGNSVVFDDGHHISGLHPRKPVQYHKSGLLGTISFLQRPHHQPDDIAMTLASRDDELDNYLCANNTCPQIVPLLGILKKSAEAMLCKQSKMKVMYTLRRRKLFEREDVLNQLKEIRLSPVNEAKGQFMFYLLSLMKFMIETVGLEEVDTMISLSLIKINIQNQEDNQEKSCVKEWSLLKEIEELYKKKKKDRDTTNNDEIENFAMSMPVLPTIESIHVGDKVTIPEHDIGKAFSNEEWYVSYMYVLFREDFVRPLVTGIKDYIVYQERKATERFHSTDVRLYEDVSLISTSTQIENGVVWKIHFPSNFSRRSYIPSVLQYGSLLCLSHDGFKSMHYATVVNRDLHQLRRGQVDIKFVEEFDVENPLEETFVMLESRAFYGAYSHTLSSLKNLAGELAAGETTLPMGKYLTGQTNMICHPTYIDKCSEFSFGCLKHYGENTGSPASTTEVTNFDTWPTATELGLDPSQYNALKLVLTSEMALIQGPPGTGKTMMGIRIAELLLSNKSVWYSKENNDHRPLLLVSYTNHALDQFLQLLLETPTMKHGLPEDVVRVGSRCEVAELDKYNLKVHRRNQPPRGNRRNQQHRDYRGNQPDRAYRATFAALKDIESEIKTLRERISDFHSYLIHEETLFEKKTITIDHYRQLRRGEYFERYLPQNNTLLWVWLDLRSFLATTDSVSKEGGLNENAVTIDDIEREDMGRRLDDADEFDHMHDTSMFDLSESQKAIDEHILSSDAYFRDLSYDQISLVLKGVQDQLQVRDRMSFEEMMSFYDIWELSINDRWRLYRYWVQRATDPLLRELRQHETQFEAASRRYCEARNLFDCHIMKKASIVAMTTTAAARYTNILKEVGPPIVIIEEAAQVSEQHVLGSLSPSCQHVILIGDHQQLKPAYNDYSLAKKYHTDVSLFERMVRCEVPYMQLENQHRMRPEISTLLVPHIYKALNDDESVFGFPSVRGMSSNVFFLTHSKLEDDDNESLSHRNKFEAEFLTKLYRHLRLQGYRSSEITVLTLYKDQVQVLRQLIRDTERTDLAHLQNENDVAETSSLGIQTLKDNLSVRITPVDNFQGEENKIILLSLVRSNKNRHIGYLAAANRVCVSLSRAKEGFYVIGNFTCLRNASRLWDKIVNKAEEKGICGKFLELKCSKHPDHKMMVETAKDFEKYKDGGCNQPCDARLDCGHTCSRLCHTDDPEHRTPCIKLCIEYCPREHALTRNCNQPKKECREEIEVVLPQCGHKATTKCYKDIRDAKCKQQCEKKLSCGHVCQRYCGEACNEDACNDLVKVTGKCGHTFQIACARKNSELCTVRCTFTLDCGHPCNGTCGECHAGRLHKPCKQKCERRLICGHPCKANCTAVCPPCTRPCPIWCGHNKCKKECGQICTPCIEFCTWECRRDCSNKKKCTKRCFETCNRERCDKPCKRRMPCRHLCIALNCEDCFCRECNNTSEFDIFFGSEDEPGAIFYRLLDCRHIFEVTSLDKYMDGDSKDDTASEMINIKVCPRCTSPIWNSTRYGDVIRRHLLDINTVRGKLLSNANDMLVEKYNLTKQLSKIEDEKHQAQFEEGLNRVKNIAQIDALRMQFGFYTNVKDAVKNMKVIMTNSKINEDKGKELNKGLASLLDWVLIKRFRFSDQELREFKLELTRLRLCYRTLLLQDTLTLKKDVPQEDQDWTDSASEKLSSGEVIVEQAMEDLEKKLKELETQYPRSGLSLTEEERIMILKAMDFRGKGHWYKCKNGHVYAIGDCGGATMESKCPECAETIGGGSHCLRSDNFLASEMDGARFSAWSEQANMLNYGLDNDV